VLVLSKENSVSIREITRWSKKFEQIILQIINKGIKEELSKEIDGKPVYTAKEILLCPTWSIYDRKNGADITSFSGVKIFLYKNAIKNYIYDILSEEEEILEKDAIFTLTEQGAPYALSATVDLLSEDSMFHVKTIPNLYAINFSNVWLNEYDYDTNSYNNFPAFKPRNSDINQILYYMSILNSIGKMINKSYIIYIPMENIFSSKYNRYMNRIFVFRVETQTELMRRCIGLISNKALRYYNVDMYLEPNQVPDWDDIERIPSRTCLRSKSSGGCKLKVEIKKNGKKELDFKCAFTPEQKRYIKSKVDDIFPLFFPILHSSEIDNYSNNIVNVMSEFAYSKLNIAIPEKVKELFVSELKEIFENYFIVEKQNIPIPVLVFKVIDKISYSIDKFIEKGKDELKSLVKSEIFKKKVLEILNISIGNKTFYVFQDEYIRYKILRRIYDNIVDTYFMHPYSYRLIGDCPRKVFLLRNYNIYNIIRERYTDSLEFMSMIPDIIRTELEVNFICNSIQSYLSPIFSSTVNDVIFEDFIFEYYLTDYNKIGISDYPMVFMFTPSYFYIEYLFNKNGKKFSVSESTGRVGRREPSRYPVPLKKDVFQSAILDSLLKKEYGIEKSVLMVYLPRFKGDIRVFSVIKYDYNNIYDRFKKFNERIENEVPYSYEEFIRNELRCFYCPYSYIEGEEEGKVACEEGMENRHRYVKEFK